MKQDLNGLYAKYCQNKDKPETFIKVLAECVYAAPQVFGFRSVDEINEAFAVYWGRIVGLIDRYQDTGASFQAFVASSMRFMALSLRRTAAKQFAVECTVARQCQCEAHSARYSSSGDFDARTLIRPAPPSRNSRIRVFRQRILFLCLKNSCQLDDDTLRSIAVQTGFDAESLVAKALEVRQKSSFRLERINKRVALRNQYWMHLQQARHRLAGECEAERLQRLRTRIGRLEAAHRCSVDWLRRRRILVSNRDIALACGCSKSVVDSGLERLEAAWARKNAETLVSLPAALLSRLDHGGRPGIASPHDHSCRNQQRPQAAGALRPAAGA